MPGRTDELFSRLARDAGLVAATDRELLARFAAGRDEAAFAALVRRHGPMVLGVCRRLTHNVHDAEDAFQATFLVLARKAHRVGRPERLGNYLYGVAVGVGRNARRAALRRRRHETPADPFPEPAVSADERDPDLPGVIDEELAALADRYRTAVVLCDLQGTPRAEAAGRLGIPEGTLSSRLNAGRKKLADRLAKRGLAPAVGLGLAGALPPGLARATAQAVCGPGKLSAHVLMLAGEGGWAVGRVKLLAGLAVLAVAGAGGVAGRPAPEPAAPPPAVPEVVAAAESVPAPSTLRVLAVDPSGKPLPGVKITGSIWTKEKGFKANSDQTTDEAGVATVTLPKTYYIVRLWASKPGYAGLFANWEQNELADGKGMPAEYTFPIELGTTVGGRVVDEQGKPIAGAKITVSLANRRGLKLADGRASYSDGIDTGVTDSDGRWRSENVPTDPAAELAVKVNHPDYASDEHAGQVQKASGVTAAQLRNGTATLTLKRGVIVAGRVTGPAGEPIKDALVITGDDPYFGRVTADVLTDADGRFRLAALAPREKLALTVVAKGFAPQQRKLDLRDGLPSQDFALESGKTVRLRFVDGAGKPVKVWTRLDGWNGNKAIHNHIHSSVNPTGIPVWSGPDGVWEWTWAPAGPITLHYSKQGYAHRDDFVVEAGGPEQTIVLKGEHRITGGVTDATTGKPIPKFTLIQINVFRKDWMSAERGNAAAGRAGKLTYVADWTDCPLRLRVEAMGYRTQTGPEFRTGDDSPRTQDFALQPSPPVAGVVVDAAGKPVADAVVHMATPTQQSGPSQDWGSLQTRTDAAGRFALPDPDEPWAVLAQADAGFASVEATGGHDAGTLRLRPWAKVRGTFRDGGRVVPDAHISIFPIRVRDDGPKVDHTLQTTTGPDGAFEFPRVPPGSVGVRVYLGPWEDSGYRSGPWVPLDLRPGEARTLDLGGAGATVTGKVKLTGRVPADLNCTYSLNYLVRREPGITPPPEVARLGFDARAGWSWKWHDTPEGRAFLNTLPHWFVKLAPDGSFRVSGVPPGDYDLAVAVYAKPEGCLVEPLARAVARVTVAGSDVTVPDVAAPVVPIPAVGDVPTVAFRRADGSAGSLADFRGKPVVVAFWASWCSACKVQLPAVRKLAERTAVVGLSLDDDEAAWQTALKELPRPGPQGRLTGGDTGVSSVPAYWLLDADGKIVAKSYDPDELTADAKK